MNIAATPVISRRHQEEEEKKVTPALSLNDEMLQHV